MAKNQGFLLIFLKFFGKNVDFLVDLADVLWVLGNMYDFWRIWWGERWLEFRDLTEILLEKNRLKMTVFRDNQTGRSGYF